MAATASKKRWDVGFDYSSRGDLQDAVAIAQLVFFLSRVGVTDGRSGPCRGAEAAEAESPKRQACWGRLYAWDAHQRIRLGPTTNVRLLVRLGGIRGDKRSRLVGMEGHQKTLQGSRLGLLLARLRTLSAIRTRDHRVSRQQVEFIPVGRLQN